MQKTTNVSQKYFFLLSFIIFLSFQLILNFNWNKIDNWIWELMFVQVWWLRAGSSWQCWGPPTCPCPAPTSHAPRALRQDVKIEKRKNEYQKYENNGNFHSVPWPPHLTNFHSWTNWIILSSFLWWMENDTIPGFPLWNGNFDSFYIFLMWGLPQVQSGWSPPAPQTQAGLDTLNWILADFFLRAFIT